AIDRGNVAVPRSNSSGRGSRAGSANRGTVNGDGTYGATTRNDTLWKIASDTLPATDVTVDQNMLAIKRINPEAFIADNINLLKAGYVLRTPSAADARSVSAAAASQRVREENDAWRTGRSLSASSTAVAQNDAPALKAQVDATDAAPAASSAGSSSGKLRIVAEAGDSAQGAVDAAAETAGGVTAEERDRLSRQLEELTYKMDRELEAAGEQVAVKERQLEVKDQEIAELQSQVTAMREQMQRLSEQRAQNQSATSTSPDAPWWQSTTVLGGGLGALVLLSVGGLMLARKRRNAAEAEYYAAEVAADAEMAVADRAEPHMADIADEPTAAAAMDESIEQTLDTDWNDDSDLETETEFAQDAESWDSSESDSADLDESGAADASDDAMSDGQIGDVIGESEIYIAYGRYPQAVNLLTGALNQDADRHDVRCKLLELYAETNDRDGFSAEYATLQERCDDPEVLTAAAELETRLEEVAAEMAITGGDDAPADSGAEDAADSAADVDDGFELALDDDADMAPTMDLSDASLDADTELDDSFELELDDAEVPAVDPEADLDLDGAAAALELDSNEGLDLDFGASPEQESGDASEHPESLTATAEPQAGSGDQLGGDLGLDFDPDRDAESAATGFDAATGPEADVSVAEPDVAEDLLDLDAILDDSADLNLDEDSGTLALDDEFDFADSDDGTSTKLDLAKAYIDMGDEDGARDILNEVLSEGTQTQQKQAQELLENI
ncbi:MAG: FimV/HubP family polar landmark protein, partial [Pseudomonadales bacterium]